MDPGLELGWWNSAHKHLEIPSALMSTTSTSPGLHALTITTGTPYVCPTMLVMEWACTRGFWNDSICFGVTKIPQHLQLKLSFHMYVRRYWWWNESAHEDFEMIPSALVTKVLQHLQLKLALRRYWWWNESAHEDSEMIPSALVTKILQHLHLYTRMSLMGTIRRSPQVSRELVRGIWHCIRKQAHILSLRWRQIWVLSSSGPFFWNRIPVEVFVRMLLMLWIWRIRK